MKPAQVWTLLITITLLLSVMRNSTPRAINPDDHSRENHQSVDIRRAELGYLRMASARIMNGRIQSVDVWVSSSDALARAQLTG